MIKLLIVVFSFFLIVGVGHADPSTANSVSKQMANDRQAETQAEQSKKNTTSGPQSC